MNFFLSYYLRRIKNISSNKRHVRLTGKSCKEERKENLFAHLSRLIKKMERKGAHIHKRINEGRWNVVKLSETQ